MYRALLVALLAIFLASCASVPQPSYRYTFVVDGRIAKTVSAPLHSDLVSVVVRPRNGESAIWQIYEATYAYIALEPNENDKTDTGGYEIELNGEVSYYRKLKSVQEDGNDVVVDGDALNTVPMKPKTFVVEQNAPALVTIGEGLQVEVALVPPATAANTKSR